MSVKVPRAFDALDISFEQDSPGSLSASAMGVIQVVVRSARDIGNAKVGGVAPDPYVSLTLNDAAEVVKTKHQLNTSVVVVV